MEKKNIQKKEYLYDSICSVSLSNIDTSCLTPGFSHVDFSSVIYRPGKRCRVSPFVFRGRKLCDDAHEWLQTVLHLSFSSLSLGLSLFPLLIRWLCKHDFNLFPFQILPMHFSQSLWKNTGSNLCINYQQPLKRCRGRENYLNCAISLLKVDEGVVFKLFNPFQFAKLTERLLEMFFRYCACQVSYKKDFDLNDTRKISFSIIRPFLIQGSEEPVVRRLS